MMVVVQTTSARLMCAYVEKSVENVEKKFFHVENYVENFFHGKLAKKADNWCYRRSFMLTCSGRGLWMTL